METALHSEVTVSQAVRSILRIKARIVTVSPSLVVDRSGTVLRLTVEGQQPMLIAGPEKTKLFDRLLEAQVDYNRNAKTDPAWMKGR